MPRELLKRFFLAGFEEYVISAQRSIRNFGKRFMESEMTSILVKVGKMLLGRHDSQRNTCTNYTVTLRNSCYSIKIHRKMMHTVTKMLVISLSINRFPKFRMLR